MADEELAPSLQSILDQKSLKWIFVGGKGGVGKTTTSCSLAVQMARARKSVLLISTDPAHNLSDAFGVKFGKDARPVPGVDNLAAMEIDPNGSIQDLISAGGDDAQEAMQGLGGVGNMFQDMAFSIPGVDEAMSFAEVLKQVKGMEYEVVIFDTAPTGHTLRFLQFPTVMEKALEKLSQLSQQFGPMLNSVLGARGGLPNGQSLDDVLKKMEDLRETIGEVNKQFKNADLTTYASTPSHPSTKIQTKTHLTHPSQLHPRLDPRIPLPLRNRAHDPRARFLRNRHPRYGRQSAAVSQRLEPVRAVQQPAQDAEEIPRADRRLVRRGLPRRQNAAARRGGARH
jgi:arsenite-transporting ATPase